MRAGGSLRFFINITGRPAPCVIWSKPGVDLQNRGFVEVTKTSTTLIIDKVNRYDAGKYTLVAENCAGKREVHILVKVYGKLIDLLLVVFLKFIQVYSLIFKVYSSMGT